MTTPRESMEAFVHELIARIETADMDHPHVVLTFDPDTGQFAATGPFPDAMRAELARAGMELEWNGFTRGDEDKMQFYVVPIDPAQKTT